MATTDEEVAQSKRISVEQVQLLRQTRGTTNDTLNRLPQGSLLRAIRRLNYPDLPRLRHEFRTEQARNDDGRIPRNALAKAVQQLRKFRTTMRRRPLVAGVPTARSVAASALLAPTPAAGLTKAGWEWLGPGNVGGRTRALLVHPTQHERMWAASVGGGIWRTTNGGKQWAPADDFMASLAVCCLVMDPKDPNKIYAGTGEGFGNLDAIRGAGIFRTTDGVTWKQLAATARPEFAAVNRLAISRNATVLLAGTNTGLFRSTDADRKKWTKVLDAPIADVKFHPTSSTRAVAGGVENGQAYYSTNGGQTWKAAGHKDAWTGRVELAYCVKNPSIVYASVQMQSGEIWRSTDGGKTYTPCKNETADGSPADYLGDQGWYGNVIWAGDPTNQNLVIAGGVNLWKSTDGGNTLAEISTWWDPSSAHADHHAIVSHPAYDGVKNRTVFFGNDGGINKANDVRAVGKEAQPPYVSGWTELVNNYGVTQFYGGAGNAKTGKIVGGAQDNGTVSFDPTKGTEKWKTFFGGDGGYCAADPSDPKVFYGEYVYLNIHRNTDAGTTDDTNGDRYISGQYYDNVKNDWAWKPVPYRIPDAMNMDAEFIAPFVLDPNEPKRMLAGGLSLWRTNDAKAPNTDASGPKWEAIKTSTGAHISAIAIAKGNSDIVWVGHVNGMVFATKNGTDAKPKWQRMDTVGTQALAKRYCTQIVVDPSNTNTVYVAFGGYVSANIWKTEDGGKKWKNLGASLPAAPIRAIAVHPQKPKYVYLGSEVGIFASDDGGKTWSPTNQGPTNCSVDDLFWMGTTLVCATHGRGMFRINLASP